MFLTSTSLRLSLSTFNGAIPLARKLCRAAPARRLFQAMACEGKSSQHWYDAQFFPWKLDEMWTEMTGVIEVQHDAIYAGLQNDAILIFCIIWVIARRSAENSTKDANLDAVLPAVARRRPRANCCPSGNPAFELTCLSAVSRLS